MKLRYQAIDGSGRQVRDAIEASSDAEAVDALHQRGYFVTSIEADRTHDDADADASTRTARGRAGTRMRRMKHVAMFSRQLYVLSSTGTPLVDSLHALQRQARDAHWRTVLGDVRRQVEQGQPLSEAMAAHPKYFDRIYRSLLAAGEQGGKFAGTLQGLAELTRKQLQTRRNLISALVYPALLMVVSVTVLLVMLMFVLPRFAGLFETLSVPLPPTTRVLMWLSNALRGYWWAFAGGIVAAAAGLVFWSRTTAGREMIDLAMVRLPVVGQVARGFVTARIIRLLGVLSQSYVPLLEVLELTRDTAGNVHYRRLMDRAIDAVTRGEPISTAFDDPRLINPSVYEAVRSGESSGQLADMLLNMAEFLDEENDVMLKSLTSLLEPVILIGLGVIVGIVALSMFLPLFDLTAMAGGG